MLERSTQNIWNV